MTLAALRDDTFNGAGFERDVLRGGFLRAMRQVAHSVMVCTTDGPAGRHGATVTAFASVSADPPTLLVCLRGESRIAAAVRANGIFTLSRLAAGRELIARIFAGADDAARPDRFAGIALAPFPGLAPGLAKGGAFACRLVHAMDHCTHVILIGEVLRVALAEGQPLLHYEGGFDRPAAGAEGLSGAIRAEPQRAAPNGHKRF